MRNITPKYANIKRGELMKAISLLIAVVIFVVIFDAEEIFSPIKLLGFIVVNDLPINAIRATITMNIPIVNII